VFFNDALYYGDYVPSVMDERMIVEHWLKNNGRGKPKYTEKTPSWSLNFRHKIAHGLALL
jgi:hypothetical protein